MLVAGSFDHEFDNYNQLYFSHIAAIQKGSSGLRLYEELNAGIEAMLPLAVWQRNFVPTSLRNSFFAVTASNLVRFCRRNVVDQSFDGPALNLLCSAIEPIIAAGCDKRVFGYGVLSGEPSSRGSVTLDSDGRLVVDGNYMSTANDKNAMGRAARVGYEMLLSHTGPTAPQLPCIDKKDKACMSKSCPDLIADYVVTTRTVLKIMMPRQAKIFKSAPASVAYPQFLEPVITNTSATDDDIGELIKDEVFAAHHFAGTAAIGSVTGDDFAVLGVSGLYVVDGSALRTTPRANPMSTIMALGRLAGLKAVSDLSPTP